MSESPPARRREPDSVAPSTAGGAPPFASSAAVSTADQAGRLSVRQVLADTYHHIVALDSPALRTVRQLTVRPGRFVRDYVEGARAGVVSPIKYALITVTLLVLLGQVQRVFYPPEVREGWDRAFTDAFHAAQDLRAYLLLLVLVPTSFLQLLLFRRFGLNFAETYVFGAFVFGHLVWLSILWMMLPEFAQSSLLYTAISAAYVIWSICGFYRSCRPLVMLRGGIVFGASSLGLLMSLQATIQWWLAR